MDLGQRVAGPLELLDLAVGIDHDAKEAVLACDALLIDVTHSSSGGRIIEASIAFAHGKYVVAIAQNGTHIRSPIVGITDSIIFYDELSDIAAPLTKLSNSLKLA